ncbi:nifu-like protein [Cyanidiococcus yangmingshanensis]|uniref:Nifu-like protein n=1 Tax=Cyanidiococcus yangmingshanensis TaxID=2690220 RepID=A0A7J7INX9_9RHOD|nr:nifu-like protein [Cyanidiococcus yangmingshanensis]
MENESTFDFSSVRAASASPLARRLFQIDGVVGVMFGPDFVTVTKREDIDWSVLRPEIFSAIMDFYMSGQPLFLDETTGSVDSPELDADTRILDTDPEHVAMIKELIETRIRPAVAEDGGSILYRGFEEQTGTVLLELQGACSSCASSSVTLKNGVENMLRHYVPEVKAVREVKNVESDSLEAESNRMLSELERQVAARQGATPLRGQMKTSEYLAILFRARDLLIKKISETSSVLSLFRASAAATESNPMAVLCRTWPRNINPSGRTTR